MHFKKIIGKRVYLSPRSVDDAEMFTEWLNDYETVKYLNKYPFVISLEAERELLAKVDSNSYKFAIVDMENDELIGSIGLGSIHYANSTAELGIFIGNKDYLSKGYGSEAIMLLLNYAFNYLNINNIMLKVYSFNKRAQKAYEKCGFKKFGVWKNSHYANGKYSDIIFMNVTRDDFNVKRKEAK